MLSYIMRHRPKNAYMSSKHRPLAPAALTALLVTGCAEVAVIGNLIAMALALAILLGTLSLSKEGSARRGPLE